MEDALKTHGICEACGALYASEELKEMLPKCVIPYESGVCGGSIMLIKESVFNDIKRHRLRAWPPLISG